MSLHHGLSHIRAPETPNFTVLGIVARSLWTVLWNLASFIGMSVVLAVPVITVTWFVARYGRLGNIEIADGRIVGPLGETLTTIGMALIWLLVFLMIQAAVAYRTFRSLAGYPVGFGACLSRSLAVVPQLAAFGIVASIVLSALGLLIELQPSWLLAQGQVGVAMFFGFLLLDVLLFILCGCWVVFPAIVVEQIGPVTAILRSWRLTEGRRWKILVLLILLFAIEAGASFLIRMELDVLVRLFGAIEAIISYLVRIDIDTGLIAPIVTICASLPFWWLGAVVLASSYYHLVGEKEGVGALGHIYA